MRILNCVALTSILSRTRERKNRSAFAHQSHLNNSTSQTPQLLAARLLRFGLGVVWTRRAIESAAFQQRLDIGIAPGEIFEQAESIGRSTTREQRFSKAIAVFAFQSAVLLNPLDTDGVEDFAPKIRIISGRVSAGESM